MAAILDLYRRVLALPAFVLATLAAALAITAAGVLAISKVLDHFGQSGSGAGGGCYANYPTSSFDWLLGTSKS